MSRRNVARTFIGLTMIGSLALASAAGAALKSERVVTIKRVASFGEVLFNVKGYALYTYGADTKNHSKCDGSCLAAWPALTVAKGVRPTGTAGLGVIVRSNGKHQVTWRGHPLYLFTSDTRRGRVSGNGVADFHVAILKKATTVTTTTTKTYSY